MEVPRLLKVQRFLAVWYTGKLFGFLSTLASGLIITEIAPKALSLLRSDISGEGANKDSVRVLRLMT